MNLDDDSVTVDVLKNLSDYRIIIICSHGWCDERHSYFFTGEIITEEIYNNNLRYFSDGSLLGDIGDYAVVTYKFFKEVYKGKPFNKSIIYLGSCNSMADDVLWKTLRNCGAETVIGYKGSVYGKYNKDMCETIFYELSKKNKDTYKNISEAVNRAKSKHGQFDNTIDNFFYDIYIVCKFIMGEEIYEEYDKAELIFQGNKNFKLSDNLNEFNDFSIYDYYVNPDFILNVHDSENKNFTNYNLKIEKVINFSQITAPLNMQTLNPRKFINYIKLTYPYLLLDIEDNLVFNEDIKIENKELQLDLGIYTITITDLINKKQKISQIVVIDESQIQFDSIRKTNQVDIYTNFEPIEEDVAVFNEIIETEENMESFVPAIPNLGGTDSEEIISKYEEFIKQKKYSDYIIDWRCSPTGYSILDIDGNGIPELIIIGEDLPDFYNFAVFYYDIISENILRFTVENFNNDGITFFGDMYYSEEYKAIVFNELRPMRESMEDPINLDYFIIEDNKLVNKMRFKYSRELEYLEFNDIYSLIISSNEDVNSGENNIFNATNDDFLELTNVLNRVFQNDSADFEFDYKTTL